MIKLEVGKKYRDREGREYECVYRNDMRVGTREEYIVRTEHGGLPFYSEDGKSGCTIFKSHLIAEVVPPVEVWVNLYDDPEDSVSVHATRGDADERAESVFRKTGDGVMRISGKVIPVKWRVNRIACQKVTIVPGEGL